MTNASTVSLFSFRFWRFSLMLVCVYKHRLDLGLRMSQKYTSLLKAKNQKQTNKKVNIAVTWQCIFLSLYFTFLLNDKTGQNAVNCFLSLSCFFSAEVVSKIIAIQKGNAFSFLCHLHFIFSEGKKTVKWTKCVVIQCP